MDTPTAQPEPATNCQPVPGEKPGRSGAASAAALALASGSTVAQAAKKAGIGERTLYQWLRKPAFAARVARIRDQMVSAAVGELAGTMTAAARKLKSLMRSKREDIALKASRAILELGVKVREVEELGRRLAEVERALQARGKP